MKYNVYDSNHQLIGKIEENSFYNANGQKEYDIIDGYFCDPITKRVDYRIHDDGTITKGTSNQITAYMHQDGTITKSRNSGIISHVTKNDNFSMSSYSSQSNGELFAIILAIIFLILSAVFIWPAAMQNDGGNILIFGVMLVSILYLIKLIRNKEYSVPLGSILGKLTLFISILVFVFAFFYDMIVYGTTVLKLFDFIKMVLYSAIFGFLFACIPSVITKIVLWCLKGMQ